jgi:hypothetical protein
VGKRWEVIGFGMWWQITPIIRHVTIARRHACKPGERGHSQCGRKVDRLDKTRRPCLLLTQMEILKVNDEIHSTK